MQIQPPPLTRPTPTIYLPLMPQLTWRTPLTTHLPQHTTHRIPLSFPPPCFSCLPNMTSAARLSYLRLRNDGSSPDHDDILERYRSIAGSSLWWRFRKVHVRRRFRVRVPGLRRFLRRRAKFVATVRVSYRKVVKRLKESQAHFGDLFAGNYLFLQVNPTPLKRPAIQKSYEVHQAASVIPSAISAPGIYFN